MVQSSLDVEASEIDDTRKYSRRGHRFSLFKWFRKGGSRPRNKFSSCESIDTYYSSATVRSFAYQAGAGGDTVDRYAPGAKRFNDFGQANATCTLPTNPGRSIASRYSLQAFESYGSLPAGEGTQRTPKKVHVKGKRRAPNPPAISANDIEKVTVRGQTNGRRKRPAPKPPNAVKKVTNGEVFQNDHRLSISNDTLVLHGGYLLSKKEYNDSIERSKSASGTARRTTSDHDLTFNTIGMPRPWYKRNINEGSYKRGDAVEDRDKGNSSSSSNAFSNTLFGLGLFRKDSSLDHKMRDTKRRSGIVNLTNISELDKEAAAIVFQAEQARARASTLVQTPQLSQEEVKPERTTEEKDNSPRQSTKALISKFNALGNVSKMTVNASFFAKNNPGGVGDRFDATKKNCKSESPTTGGRFAFKNNNAERDISKYFFAQDSGKGNEVTNDDAVTRRREDDPARFGLADQPVVQRHSVINQVGKDTQEKEPNFGGRTRNEMLGTGMETIERQFTDIFHEIDKLRSRELKRDLDEKQAMRKSGSGKPLITTEDPVTEDLKEMLKEMKHSLPKRGGSKKMSPGGPSTSQEARAKYPEIPSPRSQVRLNERDSEKQKVSSSAQTSGNVRKINSGPDWTRDDSAKSRRNGYQLIRPKDFARIEVAKAQREGAYANVIDAPFRRGKLRQSGSFDVKMKPDNADNLMKGRTELPEPATSVPNEKSETREAAKKNMNTLAVNRLLRKLEAAIVSGHHEQAAVLAKELARLKIPCSVVRQKSTDDKNPINVNMYIEDKNAHQGPVPLQLTENMTVAQLKLKIYAEFDIPINVQRWIIGKNLADNDDLTLGQLRAAEGSAVFLYLVAPEIQKPTDPEKIPNEDTELIPKQTSENGASSLIDKSENENDNAEIEVKEMQEVYKMQEDTVDPENLKKECYEELMSLENCDIIPNVEAGDCRICFTNYGPQEGVILRDCLHSFCKVCIGNTILYCEEAEVKCPYRDADYTCESTLQEREIKALVAPEVYQQHLAKSIAQAENNAGNNAFHCKTPDCPGWCIFDDNVNNFPCPVCHVNNCLTCQAIHTGKSCQLYQAEIRFSNETDQESKSTAEMLGKMVDAGEAMSCPTCAVVLTKQWGCDWMRCTMCKTEICWITQGPRWGPKGKGDTTGGCRCGENGQKCHPRCNYCH